MFWMNDIRKYMRRIVQNKYEQTLAFPLRVPWSMIELERNSQSKQKVAVYTYRMHFEMHSVINKGNTHLADK